MAKINTVLGEIDSKDMGFTLSHEHLISAFSGIYRDFSSLMGSGNLMDRVVADLQQAKEGGVGTIIDATTPDLGRDIEFIAEASRRSGVNIIATSGWWLEIPGFLRSVSVDQLADQFVREVEEGISGTKIKAGVLKSASDINGVKPEEEVVLRAVARAHKRTGVPIMLHSYPAGQVGRQQIAILKQEEVNLHRVKIDHSNDTTDVEYLSWLCEQGCFLGLDRYPGRGVTTLGRTKTLKALIDAGYADRLCPSHDRLALYVEGANDPVTRELRYKYNPFGFLYIKKVVFNQLREMGVKEPIVNDLCVKGPRYFFEGK